MKSDTLGRQPRKLAALACSIMFIGLLGCGPSGAQDDAAQTKRPKPSADALRAATHPGYTTPAGTRQECLGRLVFDVQREMQWGINAPGLSSGDRYRFTNDMHGGHDAVHVADLQIVVSAPAKSSVIDRMLASNAASKSYALPEHQRLIEANKRTNEERYARLKDPGNNYTKEEIDGIHDAIKWTNVTIKSSETQIANIDRDWRPIDLGIPGSRGYMIGFQAFIYHDSRLYQFTSTADDDAPYEASQHAFSTALKRFQFRKLYEIPKEPGICIPYGFIPDDGRTYFKTEVSLRYADRPGVIYTINTGVVGEEGNLGPEPTFINATARAAAGALGGAGGRVQKSVGPRTVHIGALSADQGAISLNVSDPGKAPVYNYSAYTGYRGEWGSHVLPFITVDMRSFTKEQEPSLKSNPPPFDESMTRLEGLLKSIRLRPTDPVMPELLEAAPVK